MVLNCLAVIETYLDAREPLVILSDSGAVLLLAVGVVCCLASARIRAARAAGVSGPWRLEGVVRPAGVTRPLDTEIEGAARVVPLIEVEGVTRPEREGVTRPPPPPREEATDEGRMYAPGPTVGAESLLVATKTPHLSGQAKYALLEI